MLWDAHDFAFRPLPSLFRALHYKHRTVFWSALTAMLTYTFQPLSRSTAIHRLHPLTTALAGSIFQIRQADQTDCMSPGGLIYFLTVAHFKLSLERDECQKHRTCDGRHLRPQLVRGRGRLHGRIRRPGQHRRPGVCVQRLGDRRSCGKPALRAFSSARLNYIFSSQRIHS